MIFCYLETLFCLSMLVNNLCYFRSFFLLYQCCLISYENVLRSEKDLCYANNTLLDNLSFIRTVSSHYSFTNSYLALFLRNAYFIGDNFSPLVWNSCGTRCNCEMLSTGSNIGSNGFLLRIIDIIFPKSRKREQNFF